MLEIKHRPIAAIVSIMLLISISTGCGAITISGQSVPGAGSENNTETASENVQSLDATKINGTLPLGIINSLGTGFHAKTVLELAGMNFREISAGRFHFSIAEDPGAICELQIVWHAGDFVLQTAFQSDAVGHKLLFSPRSDPEPINDFQMICDTMIMDVGSFSQQSVLEQFFGVPQQIYSSIASSIDTALQHRLMTLYYHDLTIVLQQPIESANPDYWLINQISSSSSEFVSPRGITVGLDYQDVLKILGTGEFNIIPDDLPRPTRLIIKKDDLANDGANKHIELTLKDDRVFMISIIYTG